MKLVETWVKAPFLKGASLLISGECVRDIYPKVYEGFAEGRTALSSCPESENSGHLMGKLASMLRCSEPRDITVLTIEGSPHCFALHASVNEALFTSGVRIPARHFVIVEGEAIEVSPESVRIGRYLHLVDKCLRRCPDILDELGHLSLEDRWFRKLRGK